MTEQEVQEYAISTYNENIQYLKANHQELFNNLTLFDTALELKQINQTFDLHFENNSFDIINLSLKQLFYGGNSYEISKKMVESQVDFKPQNASFKAFYEQKFNDKFAKLAIKAPINERNSTGNAPIIHYVMKNLPEDEQLNEIYKFIVFGVGLGLHIPLIHEKVKAKVYLIVEPNIEVFKLSLFVTNYAKLAKEAKLQFSVAHDEFKFRNEFDIFYCDSFIDNHYFKFFKLTDNCDIYMKTVQNYLVSQGHYLYSYERTFLSIFRTNKYITNGFNIFDISKTHPIEFSKKPVLLLAAGPSLQRNIEFVKENQGRFTIVAIYATLPLLERNGIKPDFITQYDEQNHQVLNTLDKIKDINFFKDSILLIASHVNEKLTNSFPKENIYIFQAMFELKKDFGTLTSPSVGELTYALCLRLGAKNIYLLGLDLALDSQTNKSHIDGHSGANAFNSIKDEEESSDQNYSYRKNTIKVRGNLQDEVKTLPVFKSNIDSFNLITQEYKTNDVNVFNLSNGAYFNATIPTAIETLDTKNFISMTKNISLYKSELDTYSEVGYSKEDLELINLKISAAKKFKKSLEKFYKIKTFNSFNEYKDKIFLVLNELLFEANAAKDLQAIITNYCQHNLHYIFHLFNTQEIKNYNKHAKKLNQILFIQISKIIDTYVICISYSTSNERAITKKLNKYLKENSIKGTIYSELFYKEIVESSKPIEQEVYLKDCIGFFAIEENLNNENFINYIKNLYEKFPNITFKIFYFFEYQRFQAEHKLRGIKDRIKTILPKNIDEITNEIEIWIDGCDLTFNIKKSNDIILNNYNKIYSIFFKDEIFEQEVKTYEVKEQEIDTTLPLKEQIKQNYILPNTLYNKFCDSLKEKIDEEKLNKSYKKEHIGFFAFDENITTDFVKNIYEIHNTFPQLKFVVFYFEEKQKQHFQEVFANILDRFEFIIPKDIYDIAWNIELWVQAEIKNQSLLFNKISHQFTRYSIYNIILNNTFGIKINVTNYLENLVEDYKKIKFIKDLNLFTNKEKINNDYSPNSIGFIATDENLEDKNFINYIKELKKEFNDSIFKAFYFNEKQKEQLDLIFLQNHIEYFSLENFSNLTNELEILITNSHTHLDQITYNKLENKLEEIFMINYTNNKFKLDDFDKKISEEKDFISFVSKNIPLREMHILSIQNTKGNPYKILRELIKILDIDQKIDFFKFSNNFYEFMYFDFINNILSSPSLKKLFLNNKKYREK